MKNKFWILFLMLVISLPCYADGGIPLWVMSAPTLFAFGIPGGITGTLFTFVLSLILLLFVSLIETVVVRIFLKNTKFEKMFGIVYKANFISTLVGFLIVIAPIPFKNDLLKEPLAYAIIGPWGGFLFYSILLLNVILLIMSYFVEYNVAKEDLINEYEKKEIKKSFLCANITSYAVPIILYSVAAIFIGMSDIKENQYKSINVKDIDNIEVIKPAFIPTPLTKKECQKMRKELGIKARCNMKKDYWAGAVNACGGVEHLYSDAQIKELYKVLYTKGKNGLEKYNGIVGIKYGFPKNLPLNEHNITDMKIWTNKAGLTTYDVEPVNLRNYSHGYVIVHYFGQIKDNDVYAICINNKVK